MLHFGASKPGVNGGPGPQGPPGSATDLFITYTINLVFLDKKLRDKSFLLTNSYGTIRWFFFYSEAIGKQECIPLGCIPPALYRMVGFCVRGSPRQRPRGQRPSGQRPPGQINEISPHIQITYVLIVFINSPKLQNILRNVSNWGKVTKIVFFPKPLQFRKNFRKTS